ncbi:MAG TPA: LacI family DNA-binding transcriptional regulator [Propionibacteriaceae bacterium]
MDERRPTIADVARRAGVSKGLVSFVVNDRPGVAPQTRERVRAAVDELGWRPRPAARSLTTRRAFALGLVLRREPQVLSTDPFFPAFIAGVETVLAEMGQVLVLSLVPDEEAELRTYRTLALDARVDGVFLTDLRCHDARFDLLAELGLPAVAIGHPGTVRPCPVVGLDDSAGVVASVAHLLELGHHRIGYVAGDPDMVHGRRRRDSAVTALATARRAADLVVETDFSAAQAAVATGVLLDRSDPPTAIVYASDLMAIAGMAVLYERGLRVPEDVSVVGFDGSELGRHVFPRLTTVVADPLAWGIAAARTLLRLVGDGSADDLELAPAGLLVRESTGAPP